MSDEKKKSYDIVTIGIGSSIATDKIGLGNPAYKNGGVPAQISADWQHTTFDLRHLPGSSVSILASVNGTVVTPPNTTNSQPGSPFGNVALTRPPAAVGEAGIGLLYSHTPPPGKAGAVAAVFIGGGVRQTIPLATDTIENGKNAVLNALGTAIKEKAAAQAQITQAQKDLLAQIPQQSAQIPQQAFQTGSLPLPSSIQQKLAELAAAQIQLDAVQLPSVKTTSALLDASTALPKGLQPFAEAGGKLGMAVPIGTYLETQAAGQIAGEIGTNSKAYAAGGTLAIGHRIGGLPSGILRANPESPEHFYVPDPSQTAAGAWKIEGSVTQHHLSQSPYLPTSLLKPEVLSYGVSAAIAASRKVIFSAGISLSDAPSSGVTLPQFLQQTQRLDTRGPGQDMKANATISVRF